MKELSINEKAKRYDEAIERAEDYYNEGKTLEYATDIASHIFPELKESDDDERIRKALIKLFKTENFNGYVTLDGIDIEDVLTWLEKQGEQKPAEWSEEDETKIKSIIALLKSPALCAMDGNKGIIDESIKYLKSIKDRVLPQSKQWWSEEDAKALNRISTILVDVSEVKNWWKEYRLIERDEMIKLTNFLKSFIDRVQPQNTWKPSDEQISVLEFIMDDIEKDSIRYAILNSILEQLKKLK